MIQRIQTVYLLIVGILLIVCMCMPVGAFVYPDMNIYEMSNLCITNPEGAPDYSTWALMGILTISTVLSFVTIFLFKKRMLQIRLTVFSTILLFGYYITLVAFVYMLKEQASFSPSWMVCLPFIGIVLNWLAIRAIGKDEVLVKAYDRLR